MLEVEAVTDGGPVTSLRDELSQLRVAVVHDFFGVRGGAEIVAFELARMFPKAHIFSSVLSRSILPGDLGIDRFRLSGLDRVVQLRKGYRYLLPLLPAYFDSLDLSAYDLVLSSSIAFAKGVRTGGQACHICYAHTTNRYAWDLDHYLAGSGMPAHVRLASRLLRGWLQARDLMAARKPDFWIANSKLVQARLRNQYNVESCAIHPFVDCSSYQVSTDNEGFLLAVGRLVGYKRFDLAIQVADQLGLQLVIVGQGPAYRQLRGLSGRTRFLGGVPASELRTLLSRCAAVIAPGVEDFGIVPLEAMASGKPVIGYRSSGVSESVLDGETGVLFDDLSVAAVVSAVRRAIGNPWDPSVIRARAEQFDVKEFRRLIRAQIANSVALRRSVRTA